MRHTPAPSSHGATDTGVEAVRPSMPMPEFIALMGLMFALIAFSIDAMLPAMGEIAAELTPSAPNRAQLIITSFVLGTGIGTLLTGPLSDALGRRVVIAGGVAVYMVGAVLAWLAPTLELVLAARLLQGLGAAGPRVAALALVRDLYSGREMAKVVSFCMMVFTLVPALAPAMGAGIIALTGWRGIFASFVIFAGAVAGWLLLRQPETLPPARRRPFRPASLWAGLREVLGHRQVVLVIATLSLAFGILFGTLSTAQPTFDQTFGRDGGFPYWFGLIALISGGASFLNAQIVVRLGMRRVIAWTFVSQIGFSALMAVITWGGWLAGDAFFAAYVIWLVTVFSMAGLTIGNLNALGMEPMGHLAGMAASIIGSVATIAAVIIAVPMGLAFDGTPLPAALGILVACVAALALVARMQPAAETPPPPL